MDSDESKNKLLSQDIRIFGVIVQKIKYFYLAKAGRILH